MVSSPESTDAQQPLGRRPFLAASFVGLAALTACGNTSEDVAGEATPTATPSATPSSSPTPTKPPFGAKATFNVEPDAKEFVATEAVTGEVTGGQFVSVTLMPEGGTVEVPSSFSADAKSWTTTQKLATKTKYTLTYVLQDEKDEVQEKSFTFTSDNTKAKVATTVNINDGATYGVGWVLQFNLSEDVSDHAAFEKSIKVTGGGDQKGAFRWYSDHMVRYRPENYWAPNSKVTVAIDTEGVNLGDEKIGNTKSTVSFNVGPKRTAFADNLTKDIKLYVDDKLIHTNPITLGNQEWPSVVGKLVVMEQAESYFFDPTSLGLDPSDPHWYAPFYAHNVSRLTTSGVFVHQALPSAFNSIGIENVSHGCIGMWPEDAKFFFDTFGPGDIVETVNTGYPQADPDDGYGDWNIPFANYPDASWKGNW